MAVADTARLIAALELQDRFTRPTQNAERALGGLEGRLERTRGRVGVFGTAVGTALGIGLERAIRSGVSLISGAVTAGVESLNELESVQTATNTVIASTQGVAGQTASGIRNMAEAFENLNATMDDKVIQSGANLLLTFTNIRGEAFEPALEAALNLNEAMGGGEEGLQSTIVQVGKALNDPIRGIGALRRVGVQLSEQQEDQVKVLMEQNDLYGAQQIILDELTTQFGGRFAAAGRTAEGRQAALRDRIEDVQKALAGPLIPAIDKVRDRLITFLGSDTVLRGAERLGDTIAGLFTEERLDRGVQLVEDGITALTNADFSQVGDTIGGITSTLAGLPWESIASAATLLGTGSKALLDAFLGLPPWVQTAVLTSWGLNKLTGGLLGDVFSTLAGGLIKGILNMNAGVVNLNAAAVRGPGGVPTGGPVGGGGGRGGGFGGWLFGASAAIGLAGAAELVSEPAEQLARDLHEEFLADNPLAGMTMNDLSWPFGPKNTPTILPDLFGGNGLLGGTPERHTPVPTEDEEAERAAARTEAAVRDAIPWIQRNRDEVHNMNMSEGTRFAQQQNLLASVKSNTGTHTGLLGGILRKPSSTTVNVSTNVVISGSQVNQTLSSLRQTIGGGGFI